MTLKNFTYYNNGKKKTIKVKFCISLISKFLGLMFKKNSPPLLFVFSKEKKRLSIHSFFCSPFTAIWLDKDKKVTKIKQVKSWIPKISGRGQYLLEIPTETTQK